MTARYLLDTSALSEPIKPRPSAAFMKRLRANQSRVALCSITWHEALFGMRRLPDGERRRQVEEYLFTVIAPATIVLPYDAAAAEWHATERARLAAVGITPPLADGQIAGVARVNDLVLVTANLRDFAPFEGISVENWL